jgi:hypothetical protein
MCVSSHQRACDAICILHTTSSTLVIILQLVIGTVKVAAYVLVMHVVKQQYNCELLVCNLPLYSMHYIMYILFTLHVASTTNTF